MINDNFFFSSIVFVVGNHKLSLNIVKHCRTDRPTHKHTHTNYYGTSKREKKWKKQTNKQWNRDIIYKFRSFIHPFIQQWNYVCINFFVFGYSSSSSSSSTLPATIIIAKNKILDQWMCEYYKWFFLAGHHTNTGDIGKWWWWWYPNDKINYIPPPWVWRCTNTHTQTHIFLAKNPIHYFYF